MRRTAARPIGSAGALVQSEASHKDYFARSAEAWEGIAYMKARAVAGDIERATTFLNELQKVDWRRYGQNGRSKTDLRLMRQMQERFYTSFIFSTHDERLMKQADQTFAIRDGMLVR